MYNFIGDIIMNKIESKIIEVIDKLRPYLIQDGGDIEFIKYEDGKVYVKVHGACVHCAMLDDPLKNSGEVALTSEIPEVVEVINVD